MGCTVQPPSCVRHRAPCALHPTRCTLNLESTPSTLPHTLYTPTLYTPHTVYGGVHRAAAELRQTPCVRVPEARSRVKNQNVACRVRVGPGDKPFFVCVPDTSRNPPTILSRRVLIMNTISLQGIRAVSLMSEGMAPIPCGESFSW